MLRSENEIYIYETEEKPNRIARAALLCCAVIILFCWILNEIGIFRVGKTEMRVGTAITFSVASAPLLIMLLNKNALSSPYTKYMIVIAAGIYIFAVGTLLTFHTTIMILFPMMLAMLYRSRRLGVIAMVCTFACSMLSPVIGYILGTWDVEYFKELILICTNGTAVIQDARSGITLVSIGKILLYIVLPRLLMVGSCALLMFYVIQIGVNHVENQIELFKISRRDYLTGLLNQNCYKEALASVNGEENVGVIFFDVNGLKQLNDAKGHEAGDLLLKRSAKSILNVCTANAYAFRLGGDEFLLVLPGADGDALNEKVKEWEASLDEINKENEKSFDGLYCSVARGCALGKMRELEKLTQLADKNMYANKQLIKKASI